MTRLSAAAGASGLLAGLWALAVAFLDGVLHTCPAGGCPPEAPALTWVATVVLAAALVFNSGVSFFWHRKVFYVTALLCAGLAGAFAAGYSGTDPAVFWAAEALSLLGMGLNVASAREPTGMSEESNPLNLPVFG